MKLILTDYIATLKEEKELDSLLQELLREYDFEIIYGPQKGVRQYGVDIYAVGQDPEDNVKKVFLLTVKQGNLDRKTWQGSTQSLDASLRDIVTVFVRNNLATEHSELPIKIITAHNGINDPAIQQNWKAFTEQYPQFQFAIWQLETIVNMVHARMINENLLSDKVKKLLRKIIIYLYNPDYDLSDFRILLDEIITEIDAKEIKKSIKSLRKINLILAILISYCERENDIRLALKATEITLLRVWKFINENEKSLDGGFFSEFLQILVTRQNVTILYLDKIFPVCKIKDGFGRNCRDSVNYTLIVYEHLGLISLAGLEFLQMAELYFDKNELLVAHFNDYAYKCADAIIHLFNNNQVVFNPRLDNQIIEINLAFMLLIKLGRLKDIRTLLIEYNNQLAHGKLLLNIAPNYHNSIDEVFDLDVNYSKRKDFEYKSSSLLTTLFEWTLSLNDSALYKAYLTLKSKVFPKIDLTLWFPDENTEKLLYINCALPETGYCLSNIEPTESFEDYKTFILTEYIYNCQEVDYLFIKNGLWSIGLIASRHYRTYVFPYYWRQFIENSCLVTTVT